MAERTEVEPGRPGRSKEELERRRLLRRESRTGQTYRQFLRDLEALTGLSREKAERAAVSILCVLEQRLLGGQVSHMEAQLPAKLRDLLVRCERHAGPPPRKFHREEMLRMVADDLECSPIEAEPMIRQVCQVVREHISEGEAGQIEAELPGDLRELFRSPS
jgi:uncharacterized protein (DUF2267 family)